MSASQAICATATQASGPIPAGSPDVMTIRGVYTSARLHSIFDGANEAARRASHLDLDKGFVAQPPQPQLGFFVRLALANGGERALAAYVVGAVVSAGAQHLHDMPAVPALERLADLVDLQVGDGL